MSMGKSWVIGLWMAGVVAAQGQVIFSDDFEDGDLAGWTQDASGNWANSTTTPITGNNSLKHSLSGLAATNYVYAAPPAYNVAAGTTTWRLNMKNGNWDPSTNNRFWFYLMSDDSTLRGTVADGYAVGVFNSISLGDTVALVRVVSGTASVQVVRSAVDWNSAQTVGLEVTRDAAGLWELKTDDNGGFDNLVSAGTATDATFTDASFIGAFFECSSTRAGQFWADDILIQQAAVTPGTNVQFTASAGALGEAGGAFTVTVYKTASAGNISGQVLLGGSAALGAGSDYTISATNFTLNGATTSATFTVIVNDDGEVEPSETIALAITNVLGGTVGAPAVFTLTITDNDVPPQPSTANVWINEMHYDNAGGDTNEGFEVAGAAGTDLSTFALILYEGNTGLAYSNRPLSGVVPNEAGGYGAIWFDFSNASGTGVQNGAPDGVALVFNSTGVVQFLSYEGVFAASNGPANGLTSADLGVAESGTTAVDTDLQLCGTGTNYAQLVGTAGWQTPQAHSRGLLNPCQIFNGSGGDDDKDRDGLPNDWEAQYFGGATNADANADTDGDTFNNRDEFTALTVPTNGLSFFQASGLVATGGTPRVEFFGQTGRLYHVNYRTNLLQGGWVGLATNLPGTGAPVQIPDGSGEAQRSYRIGVGLAP